MVEINSELNIAEKHLNGMEKWFGIIPLPKLGNSNAKDTKKIIKEIQKNTTSKTRIDASNKNKNLSQSH